MARTVVTFSTLVQTPTKVLGYLDEGDVLLTRRDGEDLLLQVASAAERSAAGMEHAAQFVGALTSRVGLDAVQRGLADTFPWVDVLSAGERDEFANDYLRELQVCASLGSWSRLDTVEAAWRATAQVKADPELKARIRRRLDDQAPIPAGDPRALPASV